MDNLGYFFSNHLITVGIGEDYKDQIFKINDQTLIAVLGPEPKRKKVKKYVDILSEVGSEKYSFHELTKIFKGEFDSEEYDVAFKHFKGMDTKLKRFSREGKINVSSLYRALGGSPLLLPVFEHWLKKCTAVNFLLLFHYNKKDKTFQFGKYLLAGNHMIGNAWSSTTCQRTSNKIILNFISCRIHVKRIQRMNMEYLGKYHNYSVVNIEEEEPEISKPKKVRELITSGLMPLSPKNIIFFEIGTHTDFRFEVIS